MLFMSQGKSVALSRRSVLRAASLGVFGFAAEKAFAQTQKQDPQAAPPIDLDSLPADTPGLLAYSRLEPGIPAQMLNTTHFGAYRTREHPTKVPTPVWEVRYRVNSSRFPVPTTIDFMRPNRSNSEEAQYAHRLAELLLRDELWTESYWAHRQYNAEYRKTVPNPKPFYPDFGFNFGDKWPGISVEVCPDAHEILISYGARGVAISHSIQFDPIGKEMTAFIKAVFADDPDAQKLTFTPEPKLPALTVRPESISGSAWNGIRSLKAGLMTRAALMQFFERDRQQFTTDYSPGSENGFIVRKRVGPGPYVKCNASFAPADSFLLWRNGKGFFRRTRDQYTGKQRTASPDDIILSLSPLYLGYPIVWGS